MTGIELTPEILENLESLTEIQVIKGWMGLVIGGLIILGIIIGIVYVIIQEITWRR